MARLLWVVALPVLLSLAATNAAAVVPLSSLVNQTGILYNVTNAPKLGAIDPRFTADYQPGSARLSATSCLMNAVNAMMELALENFTEPIRVRNYMDPAYPEVMIVPLPLALEQRIETRYLLWAVWEGIRWMTSHRNFVDLVIGAYWDGILMCHLWIRKAWRQLSIVGSNGSDGTLGLAARSDGISFDNTTVETTQGLSMTDARNPLNDQHLTVSVIQLGETLGMTEVFIAIYATLEHMAHFPSTDELVNFQISPDDEDTIVGVLEHTLAPAVGPPFFEYQWAILSVGQIPAYMLQQMRFSEVVIEIAVDGVPLGEAFLSK